jgi:hypothetical protein
MACQTGQKETGVGSSERASPASSRPLAAKNPAAQRTPGGSGGSGLRSFMGCPRDRPRRLD